jgi:hypothetical protein
VRRFFADLVQANGSAQKGDAENTTFTECHESVILLVVTKTEEEREDKNAG